MTTLLFTILLIILLIIFLIIIILFTFWSIGNFINKVPFVTAPKAILKDIQKVFDIKDNSVVYDLGCGDGRILFYLSQFNAKAKYIGIDNNLFPFLLSIFESYLNFKKTGNKVKIIKNDFFKQDLSDATHIFVYLYPDLMDELLPKFEKELKSGTKLVSLSFKFSSKNPIQEVDLKRSKYKLGRKLFVYEF